MLIDWCFAVIFSEHIKSAIFPRRGHVAIFHVPVKVARFEGLGKAENGDGRWRRTQVAVQFSTVQTLKVWQQESDPEG